MAILNSILANSGFGNFGRGGMTPNPPQRQPFVLPPGIQAPTLPGENYGPPEHAGHDPSTGGGGVPMIGGGSGGLTGQFTDMLHRALGGGQMQPGGVPGVPGGVPTAPGATPAAAGYGNGIMGSVMKAFNGGGGAAGGGLDIAKLMAMLG